MAITLALSIPPLLLNWHPEKTALIHQKAACKLQQELNELLFHSIHRVFDDAVTPPECAVNCQGSVKCFTDDCFAVQTVFNFQRE